MNHGQIVSFIWGVADLIRDTFRRGKSQDIILPLTVLRRLDCVLASTKEKVMETNARMQGKGLENPDQLLRKASGYAFYNTSRYDFDKLGRRTQPQEQLNNYISGFSSNMGEVLDRFDFPTRSRSSMSPDFCDNVESTPPGPKKPAFADNVTEALIQEMSTQKLILFGSGASGEMNEDSDLDLLVVMDEVADQHAEMVRAYDALRGLKGRPSIDILVFSRADVDEWGDVVGHIINEALSQGRVLYDAA